MVPTGRLRLFYLLYYGNVGAFMPFFAPYLLGLGFSGRAVASVQMIPSLVGPFVALGWAGWADRHGSLTRGLRRASLVAVASALFLPLARTPLAVGAVILVQALGERAVIPLVDAVSIEWIRARPAVSYARLRVFGSVGFIALSILLGQALSARGERAGDVLVPVVIAACVAGYALAARTLPPAPGHAGPRPGPGELRALLRDRRLVLFLVASAIHWGAGAPYNFLFGVLVRDRGLPSEIAGVGMGAGVVAEIAVLFAFPLLERRLPSRALLAIAFAGTSLRWLLVSRAASAEALVLLQLLHGLSFGLFWGAAVSAMARFVPARLRATGQALFSAVVFGAGNAIAYQLAGAGYDAWGSVAPLFAWGAAVELVPLALVLAVSADPGASSPAASAAAPGTAPPPPPRP
jgi:PPP family 3-phenylpropionic acid transporter